MRQDGSSTDRVIRRRRGPFLIVLSAGLLLVVLAAVYAYPSLSRWFASDRSVGISRLRFGQVVRGDLLRDVSVQGKIIAADHPTLVSPAQGVVTLLVKAGDVVARNQALARIQSPELMNLQQQEDSVLMSMRSELERLRIANRQADKQNEQEVALLEVKLAAAERSMERARSLFEQGLGSSIDYEKARDDVKIAGMELDHAREKKRLSKETMDFELQTKELEVKRQELVVEDVRRKVFELEVLSPVGGLVSRVDVRDKDTVQPNQTLFSVVDLSEFEVEVLIPENFVDEISPGTEAIVQYEGHDFPGEVKSLSPEVENSQVKGVVAFLGSSPTGLKQNQRVSTRLILTSRLNVLKAPRGPFLESMGGRQVYVVEEGVARLRSIRSGSVSVTEVEIVDGLEEGDRIVLSDLTRFKGVEAILLRE